jgi:hypothetical protein
MKAAALRTLLRAALAALLALGGAAPAPAHKASDAYLTLDAGAQGLSGRWDIALRDLDFALGLDADGNGEITWGELRARHDAIAAYAAARLVVQADSAPCRLSVGTQQVENHGDGAYTVLPLAFACAAPVGTAPVLRVEYRLFADTDPLHRGLLKLTLAGQTRTAVLDPQAPAQAFSGQARSLWAEFRSYLGQGAWHIGIGFDHILFLVSLLLPAVLAWQARERRWQAVGGLAAASWDVLRIVTAFTVAHSITLTAATLGWITLPARPVEATIAASVVLAALNNVWPVLHERRWVVAFVFGLIHGFGFAGALEELGLPRGALALALVGFNLGVELGQLAIVALFLPLAFALRRGRFYRRTLLVGGSLVIALLAGLWFVERAFDVAILPS